MTQEAHISRRSFLYLAGGLAAATVVGCNNEDSSIVKETLDEEFADSLFKIINHHQEDRGYPTFSQEDLVTETSEKLVQIWRAENWDDPVRKTKDIIESNSDKLPEGNIFLAANFSERELGLAPVDVWALDYRDDDSLRTNLRLGIFRYLGIASSISPDNRRNSYFFSTAKIDLFAD